MLIPGIIIIISAIAYSSGPFPFSYHYLGDIAVIVFFGIIPVSFTFYILTETFNYRILLEGLLLGLIINELLIVNNYRDMEQDAMNNKKQQCCCLAGNLRNLFCHDSLHRDIIDILAIERQSGNKKQYCWVYSFCYICYLCES